MFRFKAFELMNWDCYPHYRVPLDGDITLLVGQNGSGKTTFLDALRVLLNGPRLSKKRTLDHYIKKDVEIAMIKAVVTNQLVGERRPFSHLGIYGDVDVSLVCLIHNRGQKRIEKEYFILKGDVAAEEIKKLKGVKSLQYSRQLEEAGVSRSTLKLIALEQGQTDRIGQLSANELLQLVMDITGNREIIKRYEEAKRNYNRCYQQLVDLRVEYNKISQQTQNLEKQAREAQLYKEILSERNIIEQEKLPLAKWYGIMQQIQTLQQECHEVEEKHGQLYKQLNTIPHEKQTLLDDLQTLEEQHKQLKNQHSQQEQRLQQLHQQIGQSHSEWQRLDDLRRACTDIKEEVDQQQVAKQIEEQQTLYYKYKNELGQLQKTLQENQQQLAGLNKNHLPAYPREVVYFRECLLQKNIDHLLFAECIEIVDPAWQLAIEAFLGRDRLTIFVAAQDFLQAKKLGQKHRYGFYISKYETITLPVLRNNSVLAYLKILDDRIGERLRLLNEVLLVKTIEEGHRHSSKHITITMQGYRQDRRGGIFIAHNTKFYCGGLAAEQQIREMESENAQALKQIDKLQQLLHTTNRQIRNLENKLVNLKKQEEWQASQEKYATLKAQGEALMTESEEIVKQRREITKQLDELVELKNKNIHAQQALGKDNEKAEQEQKQLADIIKHKQQQIVQLRWEKEAMDEQLPTSGKSAYTPDQLEPADWLEHKLSELQQQSENFEGCRELSMITLYEHEIKQLESKKKQLDRQEEDQQQRSKELEKCREDYRQMITDTITFYNKAVKELADLAGCKMRVNLELGRGEALIENACIHVRVSFDQKADVDIRDKSLSGGQDVITSLILLVALSRIEQEASSGFFIMDEHNAHLDMLRIMEVGQFLRSTHAQFVLSTPTTENMAALAVADLILTFTKKNARDRYAPKPRYIRRM